MLHKTETGQCANLAAPQPLSPVCAAPEGSAVALRRLRDDAASCRARSALGGSRFAPTSASNLQCACCLFQYLQPETHYFEVFIFHLISRENCSTCLKSFGFSGAKQKL